VNCESIVFTIPVAESERRGVSTRRSSTGSPVGYAKLFIPSFLNSASLPLAQPFTDHTEQALCSAKKGQSRELGITCSEL
jgi:hypothetical protein